MNTLMLEHPAVRRNLETLAERGVRFVEPGIGYLACGWVGKGRLAEPEDIVEAADALVSRPRTLAGRRVLVTAGPTYEDIDPVRFLGNRSSGKMGVAIAAEAARRGASVILVIGPSVVPIPQGVETVRVRRAVEMRDAVLARVADVDAVIMAAAVADYAAAEIAASKLHKHEDVPSLLLQRTPDILKTLGEWRRARGGRRPVLVGFAAETGDPVARARQKLVAKHVDLVVANDVSMPGAGFEVDTNIVTLVGPDWQQDVPIRSKAEVAGTILNSVESMLGPVGE